MEHHIRTAFGDSEEHYGNDGGPPPQGLLQGNGTGPAGWYSIAHLMIKILQSLGFSYNAITPIFQRAFQITCFAFVDDTDIVHATTDPGKPLELLIQEAQTALTKWEDLLRATGGALAPEKSYWYFLNVIQRGGKWVYAKPTDDTTRKWIRYTTTPCGHESRSIGHPDTPRLLYEGRKCYLLDKVTKRCDSIRARKLHGYEA